MTNRLYLIDGMALLYRAYFAFIKRPIRTSRGVNTSAVFGLGSAILDIVQNEKPTHLAMALDSPEPTFRHVKFPEYKAQREEMPEELAASIPVAMKLIEAFRIPVLRHPEFEADDIIGTLAKRAEGEGMEAVMVTPDKDFGQLVSPNVSILKPGRQGGEWERLGLAEIQERWGIGEPAQLIDILGLMGDPSDNIPGVPGVGEKTAVKLIGEWGSIEKLVESTDSLKGKLKERIEENVEKATLSKWLATIREDVPVDLTLSDLVVQKPDKTSLRNLFVELEFNALGKRVFGADFKAGRGHETTGMLFEDSEGRTQEALAPSLKTMDEVPHTYERLVSAAECEKLAGKLQAQKSFCFDLETTRLESAKAEMLGIAFSTAKGKAWYVDLHHADDRKKALAAFEACFRDASIRKIGHNLKFDLGILHVQEIEVKGEFFDTMLVHALLEPEQRHSMDYLAEAMLGYTPKTLADLAGVDSKKIGENEMRYLAIAKPEQLADYACEDADVTWQLAEILGKQLAESGQEKVYWELESPLLPVLVAMEGEGIRLDEDKLQDVRSDLEGRIAGLEKSIVYHAGHDFNLNSPKQLGHVLFDELKLVDKPKKTKTGQYVTNEQTLNGLVGVHPIIEDMLKYREATKLKSTYVDALPEFVSPKTGRVHTTFFQLVAATGRLAANPNLQNIPVRSELGREVRRAFVPRSSEFQLLSVDYSQIELRIMAELSGDESMLADFKAGRDIHSATAARVFRVEQDEVDSDKRRAAKMVNFGIIYGISAFGLSQRLGVPRGEAKEIIDGYLEHYRGVQKFMHDVVEEAREKGYVETLFGRRRYLPDINSRNQTQKSAAERMAINSPIQGTAADIIKLAMIRMNALLRKRQTKSKLLLQVHDELVFDIHQDEKEELLPLIGKTMSEGFPVKVPLVVEWGIGDDWLAAH